MGPGGERRVHTLYHRFLRRAGRFGLPENAATTALLGAVATRSNTIIDVGANVGRYAWFLRQHAGPDARLFALEPHPEAARLLRETIGTVPGCTVLEIAASETDGPARLVVPGGSFGEPVPALGWIQLRRDGSQKDGIEVRLRRLDGLEEDGTIIVVGPVFMKIDVEGSEAGVLRGGSQFLRRHRPILYFECQSASVIRQGETPEAVWGELGRAGYRTFAQVDGGWVSVGEVRPDVVNYLGLPDLPPTDENLRLDEESVTSFLDTWVARSVPN